MSSACSFVHKSSDCVPNGRDSLPFVQKNRWKVVGDHSRICLNNFGDQWVIEATDRSASPRGSRRFPDCFWSIQKNCGRVDEQLIEFTVNDPHCVGIEREGFSGHGQTLPFAEVKHYHSPESNTTDRRTDLSPRRSGLHRDSMSPASPSQVLGGHVRLGSEPFLEDNPGSLPPRRNRSREF